ncbi:MAG TPA: S8 family serine peptidase, partial [Terriglobales bacterium]|nr:S8 family serine peptidase [Terriglobales bacterium]
MNRLLLVLAMALTVLAPGTSWDPEPAHAQAQDQTALQRIRSTIQSKGRARVIVELRLPAGQHVPEGLLGSQAAVGLQRQDISNAGARVLSRVLPTGARVFHRFDSLPFVALEVDSAGLAQLQASGLDVTRVMEDEPRHPLLFQSGPLVQAPDAWAAGFDGTGWVVAIIDSGVESSHPFLAGKVVSEACYVTGGGCPGGVSSATGTNSALPANASRYHGTHVAGTAAGNAPNAVPPPPAPMTSTSSGIAKGAQIIAINVFGPFSTAQTSDVMAALNRVFALRSSFSIAAANLSLGSDGVTNLNCNSDPMKTAIDQLRSVKIATVAASGNDNATSGMNSPACISSAISVGSVDKSNVVSYFSNVGTFLSLFAPGGSGAGGTQDIYSSLLNGGYGPLAGTSRSAPHVSGAWAVLKQAAPTATVTEILTALQNSGVPVTDTRPGGSYTKPSIRIAQALALLVPLPASVSPTTAGIGATLNVVITGSNFQSGVNVSFGAGVLVNNTTLSGSTQLTANISIQANAAPGSRNVTVTNSDGRFATLPNAFVITGPVPTITSISPTSASVGGGNFTLTVNGANFASNSVVRLNGTDRATTFVTSSQLRASILAGDLTAAGTQSITVFTPGSGTTPAVTLSVTNPAPTLSSISPSTLPAWGPAFTLTANGSNFVNGSVVQVNGAPRPTTYVGPTQLTATLQSSDRATTATGLTVTVITPSPGGGTSSSRTLALTQPSVTVDPTTGPPSAPATATLSNLPGNANDWVALAAVGSDNSTYLQYAFLSTLQGTTTKIWAFTLPAATGQYEVRFFQDLSFTRIATSATITVANISPTPSLVSLAPASVVAGSPAFALTVSGTGFVSGATATVGGQPRSVTVTSPTQLSIAVLAGDVAGQGNVAVQVSNPAACVGGVCASNTLTLSVTAPPPAPTLASISPA